jgi:uncharacterized protein (DUF3084 family)
MKRSVLMTALVLALASSMTACGGGGADGAPAKDGDAPKKEGDTSNDDPVVELQNISDGLQKDVDAVLQPIKDADAVIDSLIALPKDLKAAKTKAKPDLKKVMAELKKIVDGQDAALDALNLDEAVKGMVQERADKLKALVAATKNLDTAAKDLATKIADAVVKVPALGAKAIGKAELKLKAPFGVSAEDKAKAQADKDKVQGIIDGFKTKVADWQKLITDLPGKAKDMPAKFAKAFK